MKLLSIARSLFHRKRFPADISVREASILNEQSDYHQYSSVDYDDYSAVESTSTCETSPSRSSTPAPDIVKHLSLNHRHDGFLRYRALTENGLVGDIINTNHYSPFLCGSIVEFAEITGTITDSILLWLSAARVIISLRICDAKIKCSPYIFYNTLHRISLQALSICRCSFADAQILSDELFSRNPQIRLFELTSIDGCKQSFPLLTDRSLRLWSVSKIPQKLLFHQVETSFTIHGIRRLIEAGLRQRRSLSWSFGRICSNTTDSMKELEDCRSAYENQLQILQIHNSYIHVISESFPEMYIFFYTSVEKRSSDDEREMLVFR